MGPPEAQYSTPLRGINTVLSAHDRRIYGACHQRIEDFVLCCGLVPTPPASNPPALHLSVRGNACACVPLFFSGIRRPTLSPPASFRRTSLCHRCLRLPFAFAWLGMDFDQHLCQNADHHQSVSVPCPAHNLCFHDDGKKPPRVKLG